MLVEIWPGQWLPAEDVAAVTAGIAVIGTTPVPHCIVRLRGERFQRRDCATDEEARADAARIAALVNVALHGEGR